VRGGGGRGDKSRTVNVVDIDVECDDDYDDDYISVLTVNPEKGKVRVTCTLELPGKCVDFLVDTGSSCCLIPRACVADAMPLKPGKGMKLSTYTGEQIPVLGTVILPAFNPKTKEKFRIRFLVVERGTPVIGASAAQKMGLVAVDRHRVSGPTVKESVRQNVSFRAAPPEVKQPPEPSTAQEWYGRGRGVADRRVRGDQARSRNGARARALRPGEAVAARPRRQQRRGQRDPVDRAQGRHGGAG
jgi:hypothetical protein